MNAQEPVKQVVIRTNSEMRPLDVWRSVGIYRNSAIHSRSEAEYRRSTGEGSSQLFPSWSFFRLSVA